VKRQTQQFFKTSQIESVGQIDLKYKSDNTVVSLKSDAWYYILVVWLTFRCLIYLVPTLQHGHRGCISSMILYV